MGQSSSKASRISSQAFFQQYSVLFSSQDIRVKNAEKISLSILFTALNLTDCSIPSLRSLFSTVKDQSWFAVEFGMYSFCSFHYQYYHNYHHLFLIIVIKFIWFLYHSSCLLICLL